MGGLYNAHWQRARANYLHRHPLCRMCEAVGRLTPASVVDHITPHKGDVSRFWDESNWQPLCKVHHDSAKQSIDRTGRVPGCDVDGMPLDPNHPWRK